MAATALALLALMIAPGPTNALLALAGAQAGLRAGLLRVPLVAAAYLAVGTPLLLWGAPLADSLPLLRAVLSGLAALWVARLALRLWAQPPAVGRGHLDPPGVVVVTTLLNPKALIAALVILPGQGPPALLLALLGLCALASGTVWLTLGAGLLRRAGRWLTRGSAVAMGGLSLLLAIRAAAG